MTGLENALLNQFKEEAKNMINKMTFWDVLENQDYYMTIRGISNVENKDMSPRQLVRLVDFVRGEDPRKSYSKEEIIKLNSNIRNGRF